MIHGLLPLLSEKAKGGLFFTADDSTLIREAVNKHRPTSQHGQRRGTSDA